MIQNQIKEKIKEAMKAKEEIKLSVLRGLLNAFTNELVAKGKKPSGELSDNEAIAVIKRQAKQRKDSIEQFRNGKREDLAEKEEKELAILYKYLPEEMNREEIEKIAKAKKRELQIEDKSKIGILMGAVMKEIGTRADGAIVKEIVTQLF